MAKQIHLTVITPEKPVLDVQAEDIVVVPAHDGELGVMVGRAPLMYELGQGALRYQTGGRTKRVFVDGGFVQVHDNHIIVLSETATKQEDVTPAVVAAAEKAASAAEAPALRTRLRRRANGLKKLQGQA